MMSTMGYTKENRKDAKKFSKQTRNKQRKEKETRNMSPIVEEEVIPQSQTKWSVNKVVNGVEYYQIYADSLIWRARDGSNREIAGPEQIEGEHWFYISELNDYFAVKTRYDGCEYIDIDGPGYLELFMSCERDAVDKLKKMDFKMKKAVEEATGEPKTLDELRRHYNKNPRYPQTFTYESCYPQPTYNWKSDDERAMSEMQYTQMQRDFPIDDDESSPMETWKGYGTLNADQARELAEKEWEYTQMQRDFPSDDDEDSDPILPLKCPHYSSCNGEYGGSGSLYGWWN